ncbi:hypothetical protein GCM10025867_47150 (plasmid) [Frondihabitans sucicola]|uniref:HNH endonuclease n=1 Tax=Frondihabitans sucicola TaxID=1268041 RepID=A0ABN6Y5B3_9MICO|nr:HNH endonuclease signature motif containing protein [Frondihabitans sucicola]BDZ52474.1 hypothetical protein GCM10025867_47150 [Frondihabitans sucicola]
MDRQETGESATRRLIRLRSWGICERCGVKPASEAAHRVGRGVGGNWDPSNLLDLCHDCHAENHREPARAYREGFHLQSHQDPLIEPVEIAHRGLRIRVLLDNLGGCSIFE